MTVAILDGKTISEQILGRCATRVKELTVRTGITPCLAVILVGADLASVTYAKTKSKRCAAVGMEFLQIELPYTTTTADLVEHIQRLGIDPAVHGIFLQYPVPEHIDEHAAFEAIPVAKDIDGVSTHSFGALSLGVPDGSFGACTAVGIMRLLEVYNIELQGKHAVVVGDSATFGKPMAMMLLAADATVTICPPEARDVPAMVRQADVIVAAVGKPRYVKDDWIKPGAIVIDVGYAQGPIGDVDFGSAATRAAWIAPVPGGVGPMTIAVLIDHAITAAERQVGQQRLPAVFRPSGGNGAGIG